MERAKLDSAANNRRSVYGFVSRRKLDGTLALFDFPNPNASSEKRTVTITPPQQLFFLNGDFVMERARKIAGRAAGDDRERIRKVYSALFGRLPNEKEERLGLEFLKQNSERWPQYAQALLNSNEFVFVK